MNASELSRSHKTVWIDVRTKSEYNNGHIEDAILIPFNKVARGVSDLALPLDTKIYLYCRSGKRAQKALNALNKIGYKTVFNVGGLKDAIRKVNDP